jgi:hypothetical protein
MYPLPSDSNITRNLLDHWLIRLRKVKALLTIEILEVLKGFNDGCTQPISSFGYGFLAGGEEAFTGDG